MDARVLPASKPMTLMRAFGWMKDAPKLPLAMVVLVLLVALFAPVLTPHDPNMGVLALQQKPPAFMEDGLFDYALGTDRQGRDILSRLIMGARVSMAVAFICVVLSVVIGTVMGLVSGYAGGTVDSVIMRIVDGTLAFPSLLLALVFGVTAGPSFWTVVAVIGLVSWARYARLIRGEVLLLKERDFVALARIAGCSPARIIFVHLLPNVANTIIVLATLQIGNVIITESSLTFLGVGVPESMPTWGRMLDDGRNLLDSAWWISAMPGLAIISVVLAFNSLGDWARDVLDPKLRAL